MSEATNMSITLSILDKMMQKDGKDNIALKKAIDKVINSTQSSLDERDINTDESNIISYLDFGDVGTLFNDFIKTLVLEFKLEAELETMVKRRKLFHQQLDLEVEDHFDMTNARLSLGLGAIVRKTEEEVQLEKEKRSRDRRAVIEITDFIVKSKDFTLASVAEGNMPKEFEESGSNIQAFAADMAKFVIEQGDEGRKLINDIASNDDIRAKVLDSDKVPSPLSFFAQIVDSLE